MSTDPIQFSSLLTACKGSLVENLARGMPLFFPFPHFVFSIFFPFGVFVFMPGCHLGAYLLLEQWILFKKHCSYSVRLLELASGLGMVGYRAKTHSLWRAIHWLEKCGPSAPTRKSMIVSEASVISLFSGDTEGIGVRNLWLPLAEFREGVGCIYLFISYFFPQPAL